MWPRLLEADWSSAFTVGRKGDDPQTTDIGYRRCGRRHEISHSYETQKDLVYVAMLQSPNVGGTVIVRLSPMFQRRPDLAPSRKLIGDLGKEIPVEIPSYDSISIVRCSGIGCWRYCLDCSGF